MSAQFSLSKYQWKNRVLLMFAPSEDHTLARAQMSLFHGDPDGIKERDLILIRHYGAGDKHSTQFDNPSDMFWEKYDVAKKEFVVILIGKDGGEKLRVREELLDLDTLYNTIDVMPMRRSEMRRQGKKPN